MTLHIDGYVIAEESKSIFLGTWPIKYLTGMGISIIFGIKYVEVQICLLKLDYYFIYPYVLYYDDLWSATYDSRLEHLHQLQKEILQSVAGVKPKENSNQFINNVEISIYKKCSCVHTIPIIMISDIHDHATR